MRLTRALCQRDTVAGARRWAIYIMSLLAPFIRSQFGEKFTSEEARQLAFLIFCTVELLPTDLRGLRWDRTMIASEFVAASKEGMIGDASEEMQNPAYWSAAIDDFLLHSYKVDHTISSRLSSGRARGPTMKRFHA